jgi:hypothetical protein
MTAASSPAAAETGGDDGGPAAGPVGSEESGVSGFWGSSGLKSQKIPGWKLR